jgi:hypothetical protein
VACRAVRRTIATSVVRPVIGAHWIVRTDRRALLSAAQVASHHGGGTSTESAEGRQGAI